MRTCDNSAKNLVDRIKRKAPEYLDLLTAETDAEFEQAFESVLEKAVTHLEKNKIKFKVLNEEGLSAVFAAFLTIPGLSVTQESNSNGHVDLTIEADHCHPVRTKLVEAKIYDGPEYHLKGLRQLIERYSTGREGRGLLITYVRNKNISSLVLKLRQKMDKDYPLNQKDKTKELGMKWSFLSIHVHSSGQDVEVSHVGCNLHISPKGQ